MFGRKDCNPSIHVATVLGRLLRLKLDMLGTR